MSKQGLPPTGRTIVTAVSIEVEKQKKEDLLVQKCRACDEDVLLDAGDVTFAGDWYHAACWRLVSAKPLEGTIAVPRDLPT